MGLTATQVTALHTLIRLTTASLENGDIEAAAQLLAAGVGITACRSTSWFESLSVASNYVLSLLRTSTSDTFALFWKTQIQTMYELALW